MWKSTSSPWNVMIYLMGTCFLSPQWRHVLIMWLCKQIKVPTTRGHTHFPPHKQYSGWLGLFPLQGGPVKSCCAVCTDESVHESLLKETTPQSRWSGPLLILETIYPVISLVNAFNYYILLHYIYITYLMHQCKDLWWIARSISLGLLILESLKKTV